VTTLNFLPVQYLTLVVNKQGQRRIKMVIKKCWFLDCFWIEDKKFQERKFIRNQSFPNLSIIKGFLFLNEK
jgi:hypothetical protein